MVLEHAELLFSLCSRGRQAAEDVPRRTAALSHDNNPANQFVSDSSQYIDRASRQWISLPQLRTHRCGSKYCHPSLRVTGVVAGLVPAPPNF